MTTENPSPERFTVRPPSNEALLQAAARLRAEHEEATDDAAKSVILHEIAVILERAGDDPGAARDFLAAFNADPEFREPLEALVALLHRRRSVKNLGKLLDALVRAAATPEELARALVARSTFVLEQQGDAAAAKSGFREAVAEDPAALSAWLEIEILSGKEGDTPSRVEALRERAARAEPEAWRALLLLDVADLEAQTGDTEKAASTCREAAALEGAARFRAHLALAEIARRERNDALAAEALSAVAALVQSAIANDEEGTKNGVPKHVRKPAYVADVLLRAAEAKRRVGDVAGAMALLDRAAEVLPGEAVIAGAQLAAADAAGDGDRAAALAKKLLEAGASGPEAASLWMRIEEDAAGRGDVEGAIAALASSLAADPGCIPARALQLDFLSMQEGEKEGAALAASLEAAAEQLPGDGAKARMYLRAAWEWASKAKDVSGAKAALSQAGALGVQPITIARISRLLASINGDAAWYDEATRRLLQARAPENETASLWLELARGRMQRGETESAAKAFESLAQAPNGAWLGRVLAAYALANAPSSAAALDALAAAEGDREMARAIALVAAYRAKRSGDDEGAKTRLRELLASDASNLVAATFLAEMLRGENDLSGAAAVLAQAAAASDDPATAGALGIEASLLLWSAGKRAEALEPLRVARNATPAAAAPVLSWAMRAADPDSRAARRDALELAAEAGEDPALVALERFALEATKGGDPDDARAALEKMESEGTAEIRLAAALARVLWPPAAGDRVALDDALSRIEGVSKGAATIARAERTRLAEAEGNRVEVAKHAASWAVSEPTIAPALAWLSASAVIEDRDGEVAAHRLLASHLEGDARAAEEAEATAIQWLATSGPLPNLVGSVEAPAALMNLELAVAGCDPRRRSVALKGLGSVLGDDVTDLAFALAGWSELAAGDASAALLTFQRATSADPNDVASWEGVRAAAAQIDDRSSLALAHAKLGELLHDDARAAENWEKAGLLFLEANDGANGEAALYNAFQRDMSRATAFDKLFRRVRERGDDDRLLELIGQRLGVAEDTAEIVKLYWEQARVLRKKGDQDAALDALTNVTMLEPDHVGALALSGEVYIKKGMFAEAAAALARLATREEAPAQQRLISGVTAVDLFEKRLNEIDKALEVLVSLHASGLSTLPVRERLATVAAKAGAWKQATSILEQLMEEREAQDGRIQAARLSMAIWRDKIGDALGAKRAVTKLLKEAPFDGEALDLVLATAFETDVKHQLLEAGKLAIVNQLQRRNLDADQIARLAKIARETNDAALVQATLGVLVALGRDEPGIAEELAGLDARTAKVPQIQVDQRVLTAISDPHDSGPLVKLFEILGETIGEALGPSKEALGVGKRERVEARSGLPLRNDIAAWAGALGLGEFELYVGGRDPNGVQGVAGEIPALVVGQAITSPLSPAARSGIAREIFALRRGLTVVRTRDEATVAAIAVAACNLAEVKIDAPPFAILGDVQRQLGKALSRKVKKVLPDVAKEVAAARVDVRNWASAAQRSLDRMATVAAGDVSLVLADLHNVPRAELKRVVAEHDRSQRLLRFVLSPQYLELRTRLGMGVR